MLHQTGCRYQPIRMQYYNDLTNHNPVQLGRKCVEHYSMMRRFCVFCHDELVCKMATHPESLTLQVTISHEEIQEK